MGILTGRTIVSAVRPPYTYGNEFVYQFLFALRVCWFPMILASVAYVIVVLKPFKQKL